jgi:haloacetate dehalogenase
MVAPKLAANYTVIVTDLRGYGDSSKPPDGDEHVNYSKRAMALDQVEVMRHFGFQKFPVIGQDRGGRVAQRMMLDHPGAITAGAVLDIIPTYYLYTHVTIDFIQSYFHWFNYVRRAPAPENELKAQYDGMLAKATSDVQKEYARVMSNPETIHAMCEDYRAGASIDLKHDAADITKNRTLRRDGDLARTREEGHRALTPRRPQPSGRRARTGRTGDQGSDPDVEACRGGPSGPPS